MYCLLAVLQDAKRVQLHKAKTEGASEGIAPRPLVARPSSARPSSPANSPARSASTRASPTLARALKNEELEEHYYDEDDQAPDDEQHDKFEAAESEVAVEEEYEEPYDERAEDYDEADQAVDEGEWAAEEEWEWRNVKEKLVEDDEQKDEEKVEEVQVVDEEGEAWEWYSRLVETGVRNLRPLFFEGRAAFVGGAPSAYTVLRDFPGLVVNCQGQKFLGPHRLQHFLLILPYSKCAMFS